ncbi:DUF3043 domain-containing protein [Mycobacterium sp. 1274761.0]|uniref:DUF3043 domain-containing protein n=1 Tax=Mycobacterium sp. 1274761.0 TaxID=1834077 RepID=UPI0007FFD5D4|nr:DUF3043 domain-containing protein [Mycobacterium sp. 1274761.0]OBK72119.1 hypothetical protein A5651_17275 [Mycobacterium sp. 1274761.0]
MNLLGRKKDNPPPDTTDVEATAAGESSESGAKPSRTTPPKGRPTPKRDASRRRGPVAPAPMTAAEARRRRKELRGAKLSREERREEKAARRAATSDRRERMMAGDDDYLLPRDKGPVRRYARDIVDSRRISVLGLFMPAALALIFIMLAVPQVQYLISPAMLILMGIMIVDGFFLGRKVNRLVDAKFPQHTESSWKLGFYAASRASQLRRMRAPRPQINRGDNVA